MTGSARRLPLIADRLFDRPLMVHPRKLQTIINVVAPRIGLPLLTVADASLDAPVAALDERRAEITQHEGQATSPVIAVIDVHGSLVRRCAGLDAWSGLRSYVEIAADIRAALADGTVKAILLDIDSGGGEAAGVFDLVDEIHAARAQKPIWAVANEAAFSAAYAIASAAERIYLPRTAGVGSVGVVAVHVDESKRDAEEGFAYTPIFSGAKKLDGWSHAPLSERAEADAQSEVERIYTLFVDTVARNRGMDSGAIRATEAGCYFGPAAVEAGLADGVATFDEVIDLLVADLSAPAEARGASAAITPATGGKTMAIRKHRADKTAAEDENDQTVTETDETPEDEAAAGQGAAPPAAETDDDEVDAEDGEGEGEEEADPTLSKPGSRRAAAIMELCQLAQTDLATASRMVRSGKSVAACRRELMKRRDASLAQRRSIDGHHPGRGGGPAATAASWDHAIAKVNGSAGYTAKR